MEKNNYDMCMCLLVGVQEKKCDDSRRDSKSFVDTQQMSKLCIVLSSPELKTAALGNLVWKQCNKLYLC